MAAWQFDIQAHSCEHGPTLPPQMKARAETFLDGLMLRDQEAEGWLMYGPNDGNRIDLLFDDAGCELTVRIDARSDAESFIALACLLIGDLGCGMYAPELDESIPLHARDVKDALRRSTAWTYALDPRAWSATSYRS